MEHRVRNVRRVVQISCVGRTRYSKRLPAVYVHELVRMLMYVLRKYIFHRDIERQNLGLGIITSSRLLFRMVCYCADVTTTHMMWYARLSPSINDRKRIHVENTDVSTLEVPMYGSGLQMDLDPLDPFAAQASIGAPPFEAVKTQADRTG